MTVRSDIRTFWHLYQELRRRTQLGYSYSRTDTDSPADGTAVIPDGVELHRFTGRDHREATR